MKTSDLAFLKVAALVFSIWLPSLAGKPNSALAVNSLPSPDHAELTSSRDENTGAVQLAPDDMNARGIELENTFYEIEGQPPYLTPTPSPGEMIRSPSPESRSLPEKVIKSKWSYWAAGAAGLVGISALGYITLMDDDSKTPTKKITVISDK